MTLVNCKTCNKEFSKIYLHDATSRCGRLQKNKLDEQDKEIIKKVGLLKAIRYKKGLSAEECFCPGCRKITVDFWVKGRLLCSICGEEKEY